MMPSAAIVFVGDLRQDAYISVSVRLRGEPVGELHLNLDQWDQLKLDASGLDKSYVTVIAQDTIDEAKRAEDASRA